MYVYKLKFAISFKKIIDFFVVHQSDLKHIWPHLYTNFHKNNILIFVIAVY